MISSLSTKPLQTALIAVGLFGFSASVSALVWTPASNLPIPTLADHFAVAVGTDIYVGQGSTAAGGSSNGQMLRYDTVTDSWEVRNNHSDTYARAATRFAGHIYAFGGVAHAGPLQLSERYDHATDTWVQVADMPTRRHSVGNSAAVFDDRAYVIGAGDFCNDFAIESYSATTNSWASHALNNAPTHQCNGELQVVNGLMYLMGGINGSQRLDEVNIYDPITGLWSNGPSLKEAAIGIATTVVGDRLFAVGGHTCDATGCHTSDSVYMLDTSQTNADWVYHSTLRVARGDAAVAAVGDELFVFAGNPAGQSVERISLVAQAPAPLTASLLAPALIGLAWQRRRQRSNDTGDR